jgi:hypothetical protein
MLINTLEPLLTGRLTVRLSTQRWTRNGINICLMSDLSEENLVAEKVREKL